MPLFFRNFGGAGSQTRKTPAAANVTPVASSPAAQFPSITKPITQAVKPSCNSAAGSRVQSRITPPALNVTTPPVVHVPSTTKRVTQGVNTSIDSTNIGANLNTNIAQVFANLHRTAVKNPQLSELARIADQLSGLLANSERTSDTRTMLTRLKSIVANIVSLLARVPKTGVPSDAYSHIYSIEIALSDLQDLIVDEKPGSHFYKLPEFSGIKCNSDPEAEVPRIIGQLYAGYQEADRILRPQQYELNGKQVYRGNGANIAVHGDVGGHTRGAVLAEFSFSQIVSDSGGFSSNNDFTGAEGARILAMGACLKASEPILCENSGNFSEVSIAGAKIVSHAGSIFSYANEPPQPPTTY